MENNSGSTTAFVIGSYTVGINNLTIRSYKGATISGTGKLYSNDSVWNSTGTSGHNINPTSGSARIYFNDCSMYATDGNNFRLQSTSNLINNCTLNNGGVNWPVITALSGTNTITNNTMTSTTTDGTLKLASTNNIAQNNNISNNAVSGGGFGIVISSGGNNNTVSDSVITTTNADPMGIQLSSVSQNRLSNLTINVAGGSGIDVQSSTNNTFTNITISASNFAGSNSPGINNRINSDYNSYSQINVTTTFSTGGAYAGMFINSNHLRINNITARSYDDLGLQIQNGTNITINDSIAYGNLDNNLTANGARGFRTICVNNSNFNNVTGVGAIDKAGITSTGLNGSCYNHNNTYTNVIGYSNASFGIEIDYENDSIYVNPYGESISNTGISFEDNPNNITLYNPVGNNSDGTLSEGAGIFYNMVVDNINYLNNTTTTQRIRKDNLKGNLIINNSFVFNETSIFDTYCSDYCILNISNTDIETFNVIPFINLSIQAINSTIIVNDGIGANFTVTNNVGLVSTVNYSNITEGYLYYLNKNNTETITSSIALGGKVAFTGLTLADGTYEIENSSLPYIPPSPTTLSETNGSYWVNYTWSVGSGNVTDSYNITLINNSITYYVNGSSQNWINSTLGASQWSNITVQAYNNSGSGTLNATGVSMNTQAPDAPINTYIPPNATTMTYTNGSTWVNHTWQAGSGNVTDSYNISHNGNWSNGTILNYSNYTVGAGAWSNITIYAYNNSGSGTLNATGISQNVQTPASSFTASNNTINCPVGWCYLAMNSTNKTLTQLDAMFATDIVQGWFNSTSQKFESHSLFSKNQNVNVTQKSGYFYYFYSPTTVYVNITENPSITLKSGWNLVGNMDTNRTLSELETSIGGTIVTSSHWNNTEQQWKNPSDEVVPVGEAFMVNVNADTVWSG